MEYKKAIAILIKMLDGKSVSPKEKEAVLTSIGVLDWASRGKDRIKRLKTKKDKSIEW